MLDENPNQCRFSRIPFLHTCHHVFQVLSFSAGRQRNQVQLDLVDTERLLEQLEDAQTSLARMLTSRWTEHNYLLLVTFQSELLFSAAGDWVDVADTWVRCARRPRRGRRSCSRCASCSSCGCARRSSTPRSTPSSPSQPRDRSASLTACALPYQTIKPSTPPPRHMVGLSWLTHGATIERAASILIGDNTRLQELPQEAENFDEIERSWSKIMETAFATKNILQVGTILFHELNKNKIPLLFQQSIRTFCRRSTKSVELCVAVLFCWRSTDASVVDERA